MISRKEIIFAMCTGDISNNTLRHNLCKYVNVCQVEVDNIISNGVDGYLEKFVAWVLNLKKFIPKGWKPEIINVKIIPRQIVMGAYDRVNQDHKLRKKVQFKFDQTDKVDFIFRKMGGRAKICKQLDINLKQLSNWRNYISVETGGRGTIPYKYHAKILEISDKENSGLTREDFKSFPTKTKA
tara:strand:+ start:218 stop:766 length:549 start_codon:yes stop_codon:yes gene_type:complete